MVKRTLFLSLLVIFLVATVSVAAERTGTIQVIVTNIQSDEGQVCYGLFENGEGFPTNFQKAFRTINAPVKDKESSAEFTEIPYGNYAVSVIHDRNKNNTLDTILSNVKDKAISGMEGYGISNNVKGVLMSGSKYSEAVFRLKSGERIVKINLLYTKYE